MNLRRGVHEVELQQVLHSQRLEQQDHVGEVRPLYLWDRRLEHLGLVGRLGVQTVALPKDEKEIVHILNLLRYDYC